MIENKTDYCKLTQINFKTLSMNISKSLKVKLTGPFHHRFHNTNYGQKTRDSFLALIYI